MFAPLFSIVLTCKLEINASKFLQIWVCEHFYVFLNEIWWNTPQTFSLFFSLVAHNVLYHYLQNVKNEHLEYFLHK